MSLHVLNAGSGYTYLTRQVATADSTERGYSSLGDYYSAKGEAPGVWAGKGTESLEISGQVTEQQMLNLFGEGIHPNADVIAAQLLAVQPQPGDRAKINVREVMRRTALGAKFRVSEGGETWRDNLAAAYVQFNVVNGLAENKAVPEPEKQQIRTELTNKMFAQKYGRAPESDSERSGFLAQVSRPQSTAVAGFDLTFSPVKSVSTMWALAPREVSGKIEAAHQAAVTSTMQWIEAEAAYTRTGNGGVAQVDIRGLTMAMFTHRDSRAGDPDLHTHVAVSNKVQTLDGRWLALDSRLIHRMAVAASEHYNTVLEAEFTARVGGRFEEREVTAGRRPVREVVGVATELNQLWSSRKQAIDVHRAELTSTFQAEHGRLPTAVEMISLAQRANLATRQAKHEPRSLAEQRQVWQKQALELLGGEQALAGMITAVLDRNVEPVPVTPQLTAELTRFTVDAVMASRAQWRESNLFAEAFRQVRGSGIDPAEMIDLATTITKSAAGPEHSVPIGMDTEIAAATPQGLRRLDGTSQFRVAGAQLYTSPQILDAETRIVAAAGRAGARALTATEVQIGLLEWSANNAGRTLNTGQAAMVTAVATSDKYLQLCLAPAGSGKTTAMGALAQAHMSFGGTVVGLAPQASAARELAAAISGVQADTLDKLVWEVTHEHSDRWPDWVTDIGSDTLVIIDEAGLASTRNLDTAVGFINNAGGKVLLVGDDQQRAANGAGGVLRDIEAAHGSLSLNEVLRFQDRGTSSEGVLQAQASLAMRAGDPGCVGFYVDRDRIRAVTADTAVDRVYTAWKADLAAGADSIMIAPDLDTVAALNARARADRLIAADGAAAGPPIQLPNGETVSEGDIILTKKNQRTLSLGGTDFVKNNQRWLVNRVLEDGSVLATELTRDICRVLPGWYLTAGDVRLGYAHTTASVQGLTVGSATVSGTAHAIVTTSMSRNDAYPAMTRGTDANTAWMLMAGIGDDHEVIKPEAIRPATVIEAFTAVITTDGSARSATTEIREAADPALRMGRPGAAADAYAHAIVAGAETLLGSAEIDRITAAAELAVSGVTTAAAWDTLRGHLIVLAAAGSDPVASLTAAAAARELETANDLAAVLDFRLDPTGNHSLGAGPLPWLLAVPAALAAEPGWAPYLVARRELVEHLAIQLRHDVSTWTPNTAPAWALPYLGDIKLVGELAVWRATQSVPDTDVRPAGERPHRLTLRSYHDKFVAAAQRVAGDPMDGAARWSAMIAEHGVDITSDDYWPVLAARLSLADTAGINVPQLLNNAITARPLPADATASALWFRLSTHLGPLAAAGPGGAGHRIRPAWTSQLKDTLGHTTTERITADPLWPTLVARIDRAQRDGIAADTVIPAAATMLAGIRDTVPDHELAVVLLCQLHTLTDPTAEPQSEPAYPDPADADLTAPADASTAYVAEAAAFEPRIDQRAETAPYDPDRYAAGAYDADHTTTDLPDSEPEHDEPAPSQQHPAPAAAAATSTPTQLVDTPAGPVGVVNASQARLYAANAAAAAFFTAQAPRSWVPGYIADRKLDPDLFGYAPATWTAVSDHLRLQGFTDAELLAAGLGTTSRRGEVVDRFRDRAVLPITTGQGEIAAFIGRISPAHTDTVPDRPAPKYLNSPGTDIFSKRDLPFGVNPNSVAALRAGADIVLVEGPMDALAITAAAAAADRPLVPIATNGTALTAEHLATLNDIAPLTGRKVIEAFDSDPAGRDAAFRAHTLLAAAGVHDAVSVTALTGKDPAQMLTDTDPAALLAALDQQRPLADLVVDHILGRWPIADGTIESRYNALKEAAPHVAAMTSTQQYRQADRLTTALNKDPFTVLDAIAYSDPIRTPAPNATPVASAGDLGLPTPPVLSAQTQTRQAEQQRRRAAALARPAGAARHGAVQQEDSRAGDGRFMSIEDKIQIATAVPASAQAEPAKTVAAPTGPTLAEALERNEELREKIDALDAILARPLKDILDDREKSEEAALAWDRFGAMWMLSQRAMRRVALDLAAQLGVSEEEVVARAMTNANAVLNGADEVDLGGSVAPQQLQHIARHRSFLRGQFRTR